MKKLYISPELDIVKYRLVDAILSSPTEGDVPIIGGGDMPDPDDPELPELDDL